MINRNQYVLLIALVVFVSVLCIGAFTLAQRSESDPESQGMLERLKEKLKQVEGQILTEQIDVSTILGKLGKVNRYQLFEAGCRISGLGEERGSQGTTILRIDSNTGDVWMLLEDAKEGVTRIGWSPIENLGEKETAIITPQRKRSTDEVK